MPCKSICGDHPDVKLIWYDYWCLLQGNDKTLAEEYLFTKTLPHINLLYLGMSVLVLLDSSFFGRFWTCFEAFLSTQEASANGLRAATAERVTVKTVLGANAAPKQGLIDKWGACTVEQAYMLLDKDDIEVTNSKDKEGQLEKLRNLNKEVRAFFAARVPRVNA